MNWDELLASHDRKNWLLTVRGETLVVQAEFIERLQEELGPALDLRDIVCPLPDWWKRFYELGLSWLAHALTQEELKKSFPMPWILSGWWTSSDTDKQHIFFKQLALLDHHGMLGKAIKHLHSIPQHRWHRRSDRPFKNLQPTDRKV